MPMRRIERKIPPDVVSSRVVSSPLQAATSEPRTGCIGSSLLVERSNSLSLILVTLTGFLFASPAVCFVLSGLVILVANCAQIRCRLGRRQTEVFHGCGNNLRNGEIPEPLVVGRDDVPGSMLLARLREHVLKCFGVLVPQ